MIEPESMRTIGHDEALFIVHQMPDIRLSSIMSGDSNGHTNSDMGIVIDMPGMVVSPGHDTEEGRVIAVFPPKMAGTIVNQLIQASHVYAEKKGYDDAIEKLAKS